MAKSKMQHILSLAKSRSSEFSIIEFLPIWYLADKDELHIGELMVESDKDPTDLEKCLSPNDIVYSGEALRGREGRQSIKESVEDAAECRDVRLFVSDPSRRINSSSLIYEFDAYYQFDKFLNAVFTHSKLFGKGKRIRFKPNCKTERIVK